MTAAYNPMALAKLKTIVFVFFISIVFHLIMMKVFTVISFDFCENSREPKRTKETAADCNLR